MRATPGDNVHHTILSMLLAIRPRLAPLKIETQVLRAGDM